MGPEALAEGVTDAEEGAGTRVGAELGDEARRADDERHAAAGGGERSGWSAVEREVVLGGAGARLAGRRSRTQAGGGLGAGEEAGSRAMGGVRATRGGGQRVGPVIDEGVVSVS